jgi:hypothetical protein
LLIALAPLGAAEDGWTSLFNGKDLTGWKPSENVATFSVKDGAIVSQGARSHCFYVGDFHNHTFKDFELKVDVMTLPGSNGACLSTPSIKTRGGRGRDSRFRSTTLIKAIRERRRALYEVEDVKKQLVDDNKWFTEDITVKGDTIVVKVDGVVAAQWTEPADWAGTKNFPGRRNAPGTIALQGHDAGSTVFYKNIRIKMSD